MQTDVLLLADAFKSFKGMCLKIYRLDSSTFVSAPSLAWQTCLKITNIKLEVITNIDHLLMFEGIRGGIC